MSGCDFKILDTTAPFDLGGGPLVPFNIHFQTRGKFFTQARIFQELDLSRSERWVASLGWEKS
jgi:hypothetical protein